MPAPKGHHRPSHLLLEVLGMIQEGHSAQWDDGGLEEPRETL